MSDSPLDIPLPELEEAEDGGLNIIEATDETESDITTAEHGANLAEFLDDTQRTTLGNDYLQLIEADISARSKGDKMLADALKRTGFTGHAPGGADFEGASRVTHPLIGEATIDFAARERKEMLPPTGPVRTTITGRATKDKIRKANRKRDFLNKQLMKDSTSFVTEIGKMISQLPLAGSEYVKTTWDFRRGVPEFQFIAKEKFYIQATASGFLTAKRRTIVDPISDAEYRKRCKDGLYYDPAETENPTPAVSMPNSNENQVEIVKEQIQGVDPQQTMQFDGEHDVCEVYAIDDFNEYDPTCEGLCPYILHIDRANGKLIGMYRNWKEGDPNYLEEKWITDFGFIQWDGPYDIGLPHLIGSLAVSLTGALRAILDSALVNNSPTSVRLSQARISGQNVPIQLGQVNTIQAGAGIDDIRKVMMPLPVSPPSPVLLQLLTIIHELGKGVVRTAMDDVPTEAPETPVGTQLSRVEQALVVYRDIHTRLHYSMMRLLENVCRLNAQFLPEKVMDEESGEVLVYRADFDKNSDICPVSDPHIFSEIQRYQQAQFVLQLAAQFPALFQNQKRLVRMILDTANIKIADGVFQDDPEPMDLTPMEENLKMAQGEAVEPMQEQDQLMHIHTISTFMQSPLWGMNPVTAPIYIPLALQNIGKRLVYWHVNRMNQLAGDLVKMPVNLQNSDEVRRHEGMKLAAIGSGALAQQVAMEGAKVFADLVPVMQQATQFLQSLAPKDPSVEVAKAEVQRQAKRDEDNKQLRDKEIGVEGQRIAFEHEDRQGKIAEQRQESVDKITQNVQDNNTSKEIVAAEIAASLKTPPQRHSLP